MSPRGPGLPPRAYLAAVVLVTGTLLGSSACSRVDPAAAASRTVSQSPEGSILDSPGDEPDDENDGHEDVDAAPNGALPNSLKYYESHGDEFYAHFQGMPWHGHKRVRKCRDCDPKKRTRLRIQALSNQHKQKLTGFAANGVVVGRVRNIGELTDTLTEIPASTDRPKPDEYYYVIVDKGNPKAARLFVARVTFSIRFPVPWPRPDTHMDISEAENDYLKCHDGTYTARKSSADFIGCGRKLPFDPVESLAWFSCDGGCCTAQWPPSLGGRTLPGDTLKRPPGMRGAR